MGIGEGAVCPKALQHPLPGGQHWGALLSSCKGPGVTGVPQKSPHTISLGSLSTLIGSEQKHGVEVASGCLCGDAVPAKVGCEQEVAPRHPKEGWLCLGPQHGPRPSQTSINFTLRGLRRAMLAIKLALPLLDA